ncbi:MAG TPA: hypothetical protein VGS13_01115, partial [Stellaceae bacterium]|nr:hypothetical protein [Stellaceae bacterium]
VDSDFSSHTSAREYSYDGGCATAIAPMFTIHFSDGNEFLARQGRQSGPRRRTRRTATFMQRFASKPADSH